MAARGSIQNALGEGAAEGADSEVVAAESIRALSSLLRELKPLGGEHALRALYVRSLHLACLSFQHGASELEFPDEPLASIHRDLVSRTPAEARGAAEALLFSPRRSSGFLDRGVLDQPLAAEGMGHPVPCQVFACETAMNTNKVRIPRLPSGVPGLDPLLGGGLGELSFNIIAGQPGSGKTTLAHQMMFALASPERKALFFTVPGEPALKMLRYQQQYNFFDTAKLDDSWWAPLPCLPAQALDGRLLAQRSPSRCGTEKQ